MKKILFLAVIALAMAGCGSDEENNLKENINISLNKDEVDIPVGDEANLLISEVNIDDCQVSSDNGFIAEAMKFSGKINISAKHTGVTNIHVSYKNSKVSCKVIVSSLVNYIGNPIIQLGIPKSELKKISQGTLIEEEGNSIKYLEDFKYYVYDTYHFENDKLVCICSTFSDFSIISVTNSLRERYNYVSAENSVYWFSQPDYILVRMNRKTSGNPGYNVIYAKDEKTMRKFYDLDLPYYN